MFDIAPLHIDSGRLSHMAKLAFIRLACGKEMERRMRSSDAPGVPVSTFVACWTYLA